MVLKMDGIYKMISQKKEYFGQFMTLGKNKKIPYSKLIE
jgi:hypothetical protein